MEPFYPLHALVCDECFLVQLEEYESPEQIFSDYAYFSSYSTPGSSTPSATPTRWSSASGSAPDSHVVEIASNDGYLLQYFKERGVPVLGIEPAANVAEVGRREGASRRSSSSSASRPRASSRDDVQRRPAARQQRARARARPQRLRRRHEGPAQAGRRHHDGVPAPAAADRRATSSTRSTTSTSRTSRSRTARRVFAAHGCGCSTSRSCRRTAARCASTAATTTTPASRDTERAARAARARGRGRLLGSSTTYLDFGAQVREDKRAILATPDRAQATRARRIVGYGAPARATRCSTTAGSDATSSTTRSTCSPHKQGHLPARHAHPDPLARGASRDRPDFVFILPWNLKDEIMDQLSFIRDWGGRFLVRTPELEIAP